jgi:hypothetical protein
MSLSASSDTARLNVTGLLVAAVGIVIQIIGGIDYPVVPLGLVIVVVAAALVASARWWSVPYVGIVVPLFCSSAAPSRSRTRTNPTGLTWSAQPGRSCRPSDSSSLSSPGCRSCGRCAAERIEVGRGMILVAGATGNAGGAVVPALHEQRIAHADRFRAVAPAHPSTQWKGQ